MTLNAAINASIEHAKENYHTHAYVLQFYVSNAINPVIVTSGYNLQDALESDDIEYNGFELDRGAMIVLSEVKV